MKNPATILRWPAPRASVARALMTYSRTHTSKLGATRVDLALVFLATLIVTGPLWFTSSGFALDFTNHLWLSWVAGKTLLQIGHPSYFVSDPGFLGTFYPTFAFYGGTLYTITGALSDVLGGHAIFAFSAVTTFAVAGSYAGMLWLAREFGVRGLLAHAPGLVVVTSAYYITDLYGRGAWPEFIAATAIAPLLASSVHLIRAPAWRALPMLAFVTSMVLFTGSHNITLLWGSITIGVLLLIVWLALGAPRRLPYHRLARLTGFGALAALVNGWYLLPDLAYAARTIAATPEVSTVDEAYPFFNTPGVLLDPLRHVPSQSSTPNLFVQVPAWFLAWALIAGGLLLWRRDSTEHALRRIWAGLILVLGLLLGMLMIHPIWKVVPFPLTEIQFAYRLGIYVFYVIAGLVLVSTLVMQRAYVRERARGMTGKLGQGLILVSVVSLGLCLWQLWVPSTHYHGTLRNRAGALVDIHAVPSTWYDGGFYRDRSAPIVSVPGERQLLIDPNLIHGERFSELMEVPPGREPIQTNIAGGSYLVHISGLERVGRNSIGYTVVRRPDSSSGPVRVTIETTHSPVIELGWITSVLAILVILAILIRTSLRARRVGLKGPAPRTLSELPHALADRPAADRAAPVDPTRAAGS